MTAAQQLHTATFGGGCFWCTEAVFREMNGVASVISGYAGGSVPNPTYEEVCSGTTGHAEVVQIQFHPEQVTFAELLEIFFKTHDPTTLNRQGNDLGTQYRSVVFVHDDSQRQVAERVIRDLGQSQVFARPIVTQCEPYVEFYPAESDHQEFYERNPWQPYCMAVIRPKVEKFREDFPDKLRPS